MLSINEIKLGKVLLENKEPYIVIKTDHHKVARGGAVLKLKLKNLINSNVLERTFQGSDKAEEAATEIKKVNYNKKVYCVELPKFHTLLIRRNGKVAWSGNCRCSFVPIREDV